MADTGSAGVPDAVVAPRASGEWTVTVTRTQANQTRSSAVVVTTAPSTKLPAPHAEVAAASAWLTLARDAHAAGVDSDAAEAARRGIAELGDHYTPRGAKNDTVFRISIAEENLAKGDAKTAASDLISVLDARVYLYFIRYKATARAAD